jgi:hypothetical protein
MHADADQKYPRQSTIIHDPSALSKGAHATAMLPSYHPDPRRRETFSLPPVEPATPSSVVSHPHRLDPENGFHLDLTDSVLSN